MEAVFIYFLKSSGLIAMFFLAYHFLLRKETFFISNRWFLLSGLVTSLLLPLFFIKKTIFVERPKIATVELISYSQQSTQNIKEIPILQPFDWMQFLWVIYLIVASLFVLKIIFNFISLYRMLYKQQIVKIQQFKLIDINDNIAPFSFFNYIVYNANLYTDDELKSIITHEKIHSNQKHSIDVLVSEIGCALFWFNPFMWLYKKAITQNLEYIADQKAIEQLQDKKTYQHTLLKVISNKNCLPINNNFYQSLIKKRIVMLNKNQSHPRNSWKYTLVIPALIAFVFLFQIKTIAQEKITESNTDVVLTKFKTTNKTDVAADKNILQNNSEGSYIFDKIETDKNLEDDVISIENAHKIKFTISNVKRNSNGEIICIKMSFDDHKGNKGKVEQYRTIPIRPIFFKVKMIPDGKNSIGFYDNPDMEEKPFDAVNENKITTIESIKDDALIYVDGDRYTKEDLNYLDPKGLEKIEILKDAASLKKYGAVDKTEVAIITTNWTTREENIALQPKESNIITLTNGDEILLFDRFNMKVPDHPAISFTDNSPIFIVDGVQQKNPRLSLERMIISKIKTVKVLNQKDKEEKGTPIYKIILTSK